MARLIDEHDPHEHDDHDVMYCTVHPDRETALRCNKCGRPMCTECAVLTPVGYRCRECFYNQQTVFYQSTTRDYVMAAGAGFALSAAGAVLLWILADFRLWLALLLGFPAGGGIAEAIMRLNQNRKGRKLWMAAVAAVIAGGLILFIPPVQFIIEYTGYGYELMTVVQFIAGDLIAPAIYTVLTALAVYLRLR